MLPRLPADLPTLLTPKSHRVRCYVLQASSLFPADDSGTSDAYLKVRLGAEEQGSRDRAIFGVVDCAFYQVFEFHSVSLPGGGELSVAHTVPGLGRDWRAAPLLSHCLRLVLRAPATLCRSLCSSQSQRIPERLSMRPLEPRLSAPY